MLSYEHVALSILLSNYLLPFFSTSLLFNCAIVEIIIYLNFDFFKEIMLSFSVKKS